MKKMNKKKAAILSLGLAAAMLPTLNLDAQINRGLLDNPYLTQEQQHRRGLMNQNRAYMEMGLTVHTQDFGQEVPMGSGIVVFLAAGVGYAVMKSKEEEQ